MSSTKKSDYEQPTDIVFNKPYTFYEQCVTSRTLHFYLSDFIEEPKLYAEMIHIIKTANPQDLIYIYINTGGGRLDTTTQLVAAIRSTQARVITSAEGNVYSAGTILFLSSDEFIVNDHCTMMFHNFSGGTYGKGNEMQLQVDASIRAFKTMAYDFYYPFLSIEEIDNLLDGKDIWMEAAEIKDRLNAMVRLMEKNGGEKPAIPEKSKSGIVKKKRSTAKKAPAKKKPRKASDSTKQ